MTRPPTGCFPARSVIRTSFSFCRCQPYPSVARLYDSLGLPAAGPIASITLGQLIPGLGGGDDTSGQRPAWQDAGPLGASAVLPLVEAMRGTDPDVVRAAKRALWTVVDHAGRPGADASRREVQARLMEALALPGLVVPVTREVLWMLGSLGDADVVPVVAARLADPELREDAPRASAGAGRGVVQGPAHRHGAGAGGFCRRAGRCPSRAGRGGPGRPSRRLIPARRSGIGE